MIPYGVIFPPFFFSVVWLCQLPSSKQSHSSCSSLQINGCSSSEELSFSNAFADSLVYRYYVGVYLKNTNIQLLEL